jgi:CMP-N-acetylneuraminic acid synthetase
MSRVTAVVPLKERSQRFPGKNLAILNETPLYQLILKTLTRVDAIDEIYIYSSSEVFYLSLQDGFSKVKFMLRPEGLDGDSISINQVIRKFLENIDTDIVILAHATSPFLTAGTIVSCLEKVDSGENDSALAAIKLNKFGVFNGIPINFDRNQDLPPLQNIVPVVIEQGGLYVFRKSEFLAKNSRVGANPYFAYVDLFEGIDIDTPEDFDLAKAMTRINRVDS